MKLLERGELLAGLHVQRERAAAGTGALVFVEGEAGIGQTTLLKHFVAAQRADTPILWGGCDALRTPRPLGPLHDIATRRRRFARGATR